MSIDIRPLQNVGAEIIGLDPSRPIDEETQSTMYRAFLDYGVLLFRSIGIDEDTQLAVSNCFGEAEAHALEALRVGRTGLLMEASRAGKPRGPSYYINGKLTTGYLFWHQDLVYTPSICKGGLLRMVQAPAEGGDTGWIDTVKVYESLPESTRRRIEGLEIRHCLRLDIGGVPFGLDPTIREASMEEAPYEVPRFPKLPHVVHPLVSVHPETGKKSLAISPYSLVGVEGMTRAESDELLRMLVEHAIRPEFRYIHHWANNDMVLWDNRRTIHATFGYPYGQDRVAVRTTLTGSMNTGRVVPEVA